MLRKYRTLRRIGLWLLLAVGANASAAILTPLTIDTYIQVELRVLAQRVDDAQREIALRRQQPDSRATDESNNVDAIYRSYNTNYIEHLRFGDKHRAEIDKWLSDHAFERAQIDDLQRQLDALNNEIQRMSE